MPPSRSAAPTWPGRSATARALAPSARLTWSAGAAALFQADLLHRARWGRPWTAARDRWQAAARAAAPEPPFVSRLDYTDKHDTLDPDHPTLIRGRLHAHGSLSRLQWRALLAAHGTASVALRCPASPCYPGQLRELRVPGVVLAAPLPQRGPHAPLSGALDLPALCAGLGLPTDLPAPGLHLSWGEAGQDWSCAPAGRVLLVLDGRVRISLVAPAWSPLLDPLPAPTGWRAGPAADALCPRCPRLEVELQPGDVLAVPAWWWTHTRHRSRAVVHATLPWRSGSAGTGPLALAERFRSATAPATATTATPAIDTDEDSIRGHYARQAALHLREPRLHRRSRRSRRQRTREGR